MLLSLTAACTITQVANPVPADQITENGMEMCVVEDPTVDESFLPAFRTALETKGFSVRLLPAETEVGACPLSATYLGKWSWDFVPYMAYAKIVIYRDGRAVGDALYEAPRAGWSMTTKIYATTEVKVATMVDQLFPGLSA